MKYLFCTILILIKQNDDMDKDKLSLIKLSIKLNYIYQCNDIFRMKCNSISF